MIAVVAAAQYGDKKFWPLFPKMLGQNFSVLHTQQKELDICASSAQILLADSQTFEVIRSDAALLIFKDIGQFSLESVQARQMIAVVDSSNPQLVPFVSSTRLPAVTCGLTGRDTITLSSIGVDTAVVNLQRSVTCFDGTVVEPQEVPITLSKATDSFVLMALASVFILTGNIQNLLGAKF